MLYILATIPVPVLCSTTCCFPLFDGRVCPTCCVPRIINSFISHRSSVVLGAPRSIFNPIFQAQG